MSACVPAASDELRRIPALPPSGTDLGCGLRGLRKARGLTIEDLAWMAAMHPTYLSQIERGRANPTWFRLCDLAAALGVAVSEIVHEAEVAAQLVRMEAELRRTQGGSTAAFIVNRNLVFAADRLVAWRVARRRRGVRLVPRLGRSARRVGC
jgi:transcriptional regulator with XRE-family HTH domain